MDNAEITPAMIEAGHEVLRVYHYQFDDLGEVAVEVFRAMTAARAAAPEWGELGPATDQCVEAAMAMVIATAEAQTAAKPER